MPCCQQESSQLLAVHHITALQMRHALTEFNTKPYLLLHIICGFTLHVHVAFALFKHIAI
jgi:hypothetical protein